ncbi:MAG: hypothetical protein ACRD21_23360 [Vicinamibacteria bacterium]
MRALLVLVFTLAQGEQPPGDISAAREAERVARLELEAARAKGFYFVVDAATSTLALKLGGVPLASYRIESMELGLPLTAHRESEDDTAAGVEPVELYTCTAPPRASLEIQIGPPPAPTDPAGEDEEKPDVPRRVVLTCDPPLAVHLVSASSVLGLRERLRLPGDREGELRIRLVIAETDAEKLFSSVPQNPRFVFSRVPGKPPETTESPK